MMQLHAPSGLASNASLPSAIFPKNRKILGYVDPQLQNRVSLITAMPFSKTDRP
jgi:hypothetical protein